MKTGRNEACPCGSGKKFKACCLLADEPVDFLWRKLNSIHSFFATRLLQHAMDEFGGISFDAAWEEFWAYKNDMPDFDPSSYHGPLFFPFYLYHWSPSEDGGTPLLPPDAVTIASDYLARHGSSHSELERSFVRAIIETPFSFHEILEVDPGRGFLAKDLFLGKSQYVSEKTASKPAQVGDILFGRIVKVDQLATICGTGWVFLPPTMKVHILDLRKEVERKSKRSKLPVDERMLFEFDLELRTLFLDLQDALFNPGRPTNTDGEELAFYRIIYEIPSALTAFNALKSLSLHNSEEELLANASFNGGSLSAVSIPWHKRAKKDSGLNVILGNLEIRDKSLTIDVNSAKRAKRITVEIEKRMGLSAVHKTTVIQSPDSLLQAREKNGKAERLESSGEHDPEADSLIREVMEKHWKGWYKEKIPALGNRTPIQAAKSEEGRELLESLLLHYEREDRKQADPMLKADLLAIRKKLGLLPASN